MNGRGWYKNIHLWVVARCKEWVWGRPLAGILGLNLAVGVHVFLLWVLRVVRWSFLRQADLSSRAFLPSVVCLSVIVKPRYWGGPGPLGAVEPWKESIIICIWVNEWVNAVLIKIIKWFFFGYTPKFWIYSQIWIYPQILDMPPNFGYTPKFCLRQSTCIKNL